MPVATFTCPHCGRGWLPQWRERHAAICPHDPAVLARVRAFLEDPDQPGVARAQTWYTQNSPRHGGLPERKALTRAYGDWRGVCRALGLEPGQRRGTKKGSKGARVSAEARAMVETEEALERDAELRAYWSGGRGLPVLDTPRQLPDGRVAWMVR